MPAKPSEQYDLLQQGSQVSPDPQCILFNFLFKG